MQHKDAPTGHMHIIHNFEFETVKERDSYTPSIEDLNKICLVNNPYCFYALKSVDPIEWKILGEVVVNVGDLDVYTKAQSEERFMTSDEVSEAIKNKQNTYNVSSTEYECGYTRGGKKVYGIEVDCGALPSATTKTVDIPNYNANYTYWIDVTKSYATTATKSATMPIPNVANSPYHVLIDIQSGKIRIIDYYSGYNGFTVTKIVLNYTKEA